MKRENQASCSEELTTLFLHVAFGGDGVEKFRADFPADLFADHAVIVVDVGLLDSEFRGDRFVGGFLLRLSEIVEFEDAEGDLLSLFVKAVSDGGNGALAHLDRP